MRKDADKSGGNSRSFAYYRSPPIHTLWAGEHISTITEEDNIYNDKDKEAKEKTKSKK